MSSKSKSREAKTKRDHIIKRVDRFIEYVSNFNKETDNISEWRIRLDAVTPLLDYFDRVLADIEGVPNPILIWIRKPLNSKKNILMSLVRQRQHLPRVKRLRCRQRVQIQNKVTRMRKWILISNYST